MISLARYEISGQTDTETDSKPDTGLLGFISNKSLPFFGKVCIFYSRTDRAPPTIRRMDKILVGGGGGGRESH